MKDLFYAELRNRIKDMNTSDNEQEEDSGENNDEDDENNV